jgi:hypothetical protein
MLSSESLAQQFLMEILILLVWGHDLGIDFSFSSLPSSLPPFLPIVQVILMNALN